MEKRFILFVLTLLVFNSFGQLIDSKDRHELIVSLKKNSPPLKPVATFSPNSISAEKLSELKKVFGLNKAIPIEYEKQILIALSFFPELKSHRIEFRTNNIQTTMSCRPNAASLMRRYNRDYVIYIDNDDEGEGVLLKDVPFNAQIGVIGHELCHIIDYENRTTTSITKLGLNYVSGLYPPEFEQSIDKLTIERGLGWQLYDWAYFVLNESRASAAYKEFKRLTYLVPEQIKLMINSK